MQDFPKGSKVKLVAGGPTMVVSYELMNGKLVCQWFVGKKLESGQFTPESLVIANDDEKE